MMGRFILKIHDEKDSIDYYLEWSTIVDAPVTYGFTLDEFKYYYMGEYGQRGMDDLDERLKIVEEKGCSSRHPFDTPESFFELNRAGENEKWIDKEEILERYCRNRIG